MPTTRVPDTIYTEEHELLVSILRDARAKAGLTQAEVADLLNRPQSFVSKYESGQRRLDFVEVAELCRVFSIKLVTVARRIEELSTRKRSRRRS